MHSGRMAHPYRCRKRHASFIPNDRNGSKLIFWFGGSTRAAPARRLRAAPQGAAQAPQRGVPRGSGLLRPHPALRAHGRHACRPRFGADPRRPDRRIRRHHRRRSSGGHGGAIPPATLRRSGAARAHRSGSRSVTVDFSFTITTTRVRPKHAPAHAGRPGSTRLSLARERLARCVAGRAADRLLGSSRAAPDPRHLSSGSAPQTRRFPHRAAPRRRLAPAGAARGSGTAPARRPAGHRSAPARHAAGCRSASSRYAAGL
jgi:hypothetical protein